MVNSSTIVDIARQLVDKANMQAFELDEIDKWITTSNPVEAYRRPHTAPNAEKLALQKLAYTPVLELIIAEVAQQMIVDQVSVGDDAEASRRVFEPWDRNGMPSKQYALWHSMLGYALSHLLVLPSATVSPVDGKRAAHMIPFSPRSLYVDWNDQLEDEYPAYALRMVGPPGQWHGLRLYDDEFAHFLTRDPDDGKIVYVESRPHNMGVCPVVTFSNDLDLECRSHGEVAKYRVVAQRLNKTVQDRLLAQHYNSWKIRTAEGVEVDSDEERARTRQVLAQDDILIGGEGVKFGTLPETQLDGLLRAAEADRDMLAAVSQTPVWALNGGQLVNLSAEALAEARSMQRLKVSQKQRSNGVGVARALRLAAFAEQRYEDAERFDMSVQWQDVEARSLGSVADGLQKLQSMGIPTSLLVEMIPGLSAAKVGQWRKHIDSVVSGSDRIAAILERQINGEHK